MQETWRRADAQGGELASRPDTDELVVDLDVPVEIDADALEAIEAETRRIVFNILFVSFAIAVFIVVVSLR